MSDGLDGSRTGISFRRLDRKSTQSTNAHLSDSWSTLETDSRAGSASELQHVSSESEGSPLLALGLRGFLVVAVPLSEETAGTAGAALMGEKEAATAAVEGS
jgi:hypothetical protein